jgi:hypothetical protein
VSEGVIPSIIQVRYRNKNSFASPLLVGSCCWQHKYSVMCILSFCCVYIVLPCLCLLWFQMGGGVYIGCVHIASTVGTKLHSRRWCIAYYHTFASLSLSLQRGPGRRKGEGSHPVPDQHPQLQKGERVTLNTTALPYPSVPTYKSCSGEHPTFRHGLLRNQSIEQ